MFGQRQIVRPGHPLWRSDVLVWADGVTPMVHAPKAPKTVLASQPTLRNRTIHTGLGVDGFGGVSLRTSDTPECDYTNSMSLGVLVYLFSNVGNGEQLTMLSRATYASESVNTGYQLQIKPPDDAAGNIGWNFILFNNNGAASYGLAYNGNLTKGLHHIVGTTDGTTRRLYVDGVQRNTSANATCLSSSAASSMAVGGNTTLFNRGAVVHGWAMRRVLTASQIAQLWREAQCDPLPFLSMPGLGLSAAFNPAWAMQANSVICPGGMGRA